MKQPNCPMCGIELSEFMGERMHPNDPKYGVTVACANPNCPAPEVMGHGKTAKEAWGVIQDKFLERKDRK